MGNLMKLNQWLVLGIFFYVYNYDDRDHPRGLNWCNWRFGRFTGRDGHSDHDGAGLC